MGFFYKNQNSPSRRGRNSPLDRSQIITKGMWHNLNIIGVIISSRTGNTGGTCNSPWGTWGTCNTWIWSWLGWGFRTATSGWGPTLVCSSVWTSATIYRINVNAPAKNKNISKKSEFYMYTKFGPPMTSWEIYTYLFFGNLNLFIAQNDKKKTGYRFAKMSLEVKLWFSINIIF